MANVVYIARVAGGRTGRRTRQNGQTSQNEQWKYRVVFDAAGWTVAQAITAVAGGVSIPGDGAALPGTMLVVTDKQGDERPQNFCECIVTVTFSLPAPGTNESPRYGGNWNITIAGSGITYEFEVCSYRDPSDTMDKMITASSEEMLQPLRKQTYQRERIVVEWDTNVPNWALYEACRGKSNSTAITVTIGAPAAWNPALSYVVGVCVSTWDDSGQRQIWRAAVVNSGQDPRATTGSWTAGTWGGQRTWAENTINCEDIQWRAVIDANGATATHVVAVLIYDAGTWQYAPIDEGFMELDPAGNQRRILECVPSSTIAADYEVKRKGGAAAKAVPSYLDGSGHQLVGVTNPVKRGPFPMLVETDQIAVLLRGA